MAVNINVPGTGPEKLFLFSDLFKQSAETRFVNASQHAQPFKIFGDNKRHDDHSVTSIQTLIPILSRILTTFAD
jgi:hypothetical protein